MIDLTDVICAIIGGTIGTYLGAFFINNQQQKRYKNIRKIAIKSLALIKKYKKRTYSEASNDFNTSLNLTEKRAILVVLHKLGVPFNFEKLGNFNIADVLLGNDIVDAEEIDNMIYQIESGNCDHFFFYDVDEYFGKNILIKYKRNIAKKFVENVFAKSKMDIKYNTIVYPEKVVGTIWHWRI